MAVKKPYKKRKRSPKKGTSNRGSPKKKCPRGKLLNPSSGRCVKRSGSIGQQLQRSPKRSPKRGRKGSRGSRGSGGLIPCTSNQIRNPQTGRCVSRSGAIGQEILRKWNVPTSQRNTNRNSGLAPCKKLEIRHPATKKCIPMDSTTGQAVMERCPLESVSGSIPFCDIPIWEAPIQSTSSPIRLKLVRRTLTKSGSGWVEKNKNVRIDEFANKWGESFGGALPEDYDLGKVLQAGKNSTVLLICTDRRRRCDQVVKLMKVDTPYSGVSETTFRNEMSHVIHEYQMHQIFALSGLTYPITRAATYGMPNQRAVGVAFTMALFTANMGTMIDQLGNDLNGLHRLLDQTVNRIREMHDRRLTHGDLHFGNIVYCSDTQSVEFIDFSYASDRVFDPILDWMTLLRGCRFFREYETREWAYGTLWTEFVRLYPEYRKQVETFSGVVDLMDQRYATYFDAIRET
jgi:hypothetical protein